MAVDPVGAQEFSDLMMSSLRALDVSSQIPQKIAIAVSGGPDSLALALLLYRWGAAMESDLELHALIVDHGLRPEAAQEAGAAKTQLLAIGYQHVKILRWSDPKPDSRIQEEARAARFSLMEGYCRQNEIDVLCLAHHADDQAETVLMRFAAGSGPDGLGGMREVQKQGCLTLLRPLLSLPKSRLHATCEEAYLAPVEDPSNNQDRFARVRLRKAAKILEGEGLTVKRLLKLSERAQMATDALDSYAKISLRQCLQLQNTKQIVLQRARLVCLPQDICIRIVALCLETLVSRGRYGVRFEKIEQLCTDLYNTPSFRKRSLGGVIFSVDRKRDVFVMQVEER